MTGSHTVCASCGKRCYPSVKAAHRALSAASNRVRVYRCNGYFHVTDGEKMDAPSQKYWRQHLLT